MATLKDLSRALGLSVTQVSRALNGHSDVSVQTRERVLDAARALNYRPNVAARRLVTGQSGIVGLVMPGVPDALSERMYMRIVGGLSAHFARAGLQFIFHISEPGEDQIEVYRKLISSGALDGFVLMETRVPDPRIDFLREMNVPFVLHGRTVEHPDYPFFDIDNVDVAQRLTRYLIDRGHRRIGFVNGEEGRAYTHQREAGYRATLEAAGLAFDPAIYTAGQMVEGHGMRAAVQMFADPARAPTAIICSSTLIAGGVYQALYVLGLKVPEDVSVVAHDDLLPDIDAARFAPPLTCTFSPLQDSWRPLAESLIKALKGRPLAEMQEVHDVEFFERGSVGPPRPDF